MKFIQTFVRNPVAANMMMIIILGGGLLAGLMVPREIFPEFSADIVTVSVPYPGASPEDIQRGICWKIEDYLKNVEGVKEITSSASEGMGVVTVECQTYANVRDVLDDVKQEVDKIEFPPKAEDPVIKEATLRRHVIQVAVYGDTSERTLKEIAQDIKDDLTALDPISQVSLAGVRKYEISIEVDEKTLRQYKLRMKDIAQRIRENSFDLPAGRLKTKAGDYTLRIQNQKYRAKEYETIPVRFLADGTVIYLRDLAKVHETFEDIDTSGRFHGKPAVLVGVFKTPEEDTIKIAKAVREYIDGTAAGPAGGSMLDKLLFNIKVLFGYEVKPGKNDEMPVGVQLATWSDSSKLVSDRLNLLLNNGMWGLILVIGVLWLFLGWRLSFWVSLGIPISILGALLMMFLFGQSLNMISMFALIMALGLIVDDAIVVGENVYTATQRGEMPSIAAVHGTKQVTFPVIGAVVTTWLAFIPLFFIQGIMGKFIRQMPGVVIATLAFSLLECLTILPSHLAHSLEKQRQIRAQLHLPTLMNRWRHFAGRIRTRIDNTIQGFIDRVFIPFYRKAVRYRYITLALTLAVLAIMLGAMRAGFIRVTIFPKVDSDTLTANLTLPTGTPVTRTEEVTARMTQAAIQLNDAFQTPSGKPLIQRAYTLIGSQAGKHGGGSAGGGHVGQVIIELLPSEERGTAFTSEDIKRKWRQLTGPVPDALSMTFGAFQGGPGGKGLELRVLADSTSDAKIIAERLKKRLAGFSGVSDIEDDAFPGKMELKFGLKRKAYALGITEQMLANQLRDAFYGNESIEIQRGRDEIKVMVRYPEARRRSLSDMETKRIRTLDGNEVPLLTIADIRAERGYTTLKRASGKSVVTVSADVDEELANAEQILNTLAEEGYFQSVVADVPDAKIDLRGQRQQRTESLDALKVWFPIALLGIYTILATIFRSYVQPAIVMVAIPFGLIGAVIGHWVMGFDLTLLSMFGMVALAGIVVNDSLVLIDMVNTEIRRGMDIHAAAQSSARGRFRPIFLTTITTVVGMTPLLMETSFQAQFLKPMAVSISFGLLFATLLTLIVVPCLCLIGNDLRRVHHWIWQGHWPTREEVLKHHGTEA